MRAVAVLVVAAVAVLVTTPRAHATECTELAALFHASGHDGSAVDLSLHSKLQRFQDMDASSSESPWNSPAHHDHIDDMNGMTRVTAGDDFQVTTIPLRARERVQFSVLAIEADRVGWLWRWQASSREPPAIRLRLVAGRGVAARVLMESSTAHGTNVQGHGWTGATMESKLARRIHCRSTNPWLRATLLEFRFAMPESPLVHVDEPLRLVLTVKHAKLGSVFTSQEFTLVDGSEQPTVSGQRSAFPPRQHFNYQFGTDGMLTPVLPDMAARALGVPKLPFAYTDNVPDDGVLPLGSTLALRFLHYKPFSPAFDMLRWTAVSVHKFAGGDATVQGTQASSPSIFTSMLRAYDAESCESVDRTIEGTRTFRMVEAPMSVPSTLVMPAHCRFPRGDNLHWSGRNFDIVDGQLYAYRVEVPATTLDSAPAGWYYVKIQNSMRLQAPSSERWWMRMAASPLHVFNWLRAQEVVTGFFYVGGVPSSVISLPASPIVDSRDLSDLRGAVLAGDMEWTTSVLDHDQDAARQLASTDLGGKSPLHIAAEHGLYDIVQLLLRHIHANFNRNDAHALIELHDNDGNTALHLSCRQGVALAELLLDYGANANAVNALGDTPLHQCARVGDVDMCRLLLWKGARMDIRNARRDTPLRLALSRVDLVLSKMFIDHQGWTASTIDEEVEGDEEALTWFCDGVRLKVMRMRGGENVPSVRPSLVAAQVLDGWCRAQLARLGRYGFGDLVDAEEAWTWS